MKKGYLVLEGEILQGKVVNNLFTTGNDSNIIEISTEKQAKDMLNKYLYTDKCNLSRFENAFEEILFKDCDKKFNISLEKYKLRNDGDGKSKNNLAFIFSLRGLESDVDKFINYIDSIGLSRIKYAGSGYSNNHTFLMQYVWEVNNTNDVNSIVKEVDSFVSNYEKLNNTKIIGIDNREYFSKVLPVKLFKSTLLVKGNE